MNNKYYKLLIGVLISLVSIGCNQKSFLTRSPDNVISPNQFFSSKKLILSNVGNLYNQINQFYGLTQPWNYANFDDAFYSNSVDYYRFKNNNYPYNMWSYWNYAYLHNINLFLDRIKADDALQPEDKNRFLGEGLFLRAYFYFNEVKSMGGVPIVLDTLKYDFSGNASSLYRKRAPEAKVYDLIINEADSAAGILPKDPSTKERATWGAAMALKSTAALFAGSIAQHGATTPSVSLPNNIVGIPANQAKHYYTIALNAAQKIIQSKEYHLYMKYPDSLKKNFAELFLDKNNNPEVIFARGYKLQSKTQAFSQLNMPHSIITEIGDGGRLNPSLNFVQSFEKLNGTFAPYKVKNAGGKYIRYAQKLDIFKDRDARLAGTVLLPGSQFRSENMDIKAGYFLPQNPKGQQFITGSSLGAQGKLPGQNKSIEIVGKDGPINGVQLATQTGFYIRKYLDPTPGSAQRGTQSAVRWIFFRYAEVLLNAAEASYQLGEKDLAAQYLNLIRKRAGFGPHSLKPSQITFKRIVHARLTELAFEGHRLWDMKRWRLAHKIWNGRKTDLNHPANPAAPSTRPWGLWPYKVYDPGKPDNGKWIYKRVLPNQATASDKFRLGNYYSTIPANVLGQNPKLVKNPNH
jgi:hypothetical protein